MKVIQLIFILFQFTNCSVQKSIYDEDSLQTEQIELSYLDIRKDPIPGKCYRRLKFEEGDMGWYECFCDDAELEFSIAADCLEKLGYILEYRKHFMTKDGSALIDFQRKNNMVEGIFDEASLYLLIQKTKSIK